MAFSPNKVQVGPGTLYAAPLGTTEPTAVTGAWPTGWTEIGYTEKGNDFDYAPTFQDVEVEEELVPIRKTPTTAKISVGFAMAELTVQNRVLALNGGIGSGQLAGITGTNPDGSQWVEPPSLGSEVRVMLGWDALPKGATSGNGFARVIYRQCINTGGVKITHQKGSNKSVLTVTFELEYPSSGLAPFREIIPATLAS